MKRLRSAHISLRRDNRPLIIFGSRIIVSDLLGAKVVATSTRLASVESPRRAVVSAALARLEAA